MEVLADHYRVSLHGQCCDHRAYIVLTVVVHDIVGRDESGYISPCLMWQVWVYLPVVLHSSGTPYGLVDIVWPGVVCSNDEVPVAEDAVEVAEIVCCCV